MPRSGAEARRRLQQAALDLYRERGFDRTTTAEIAARAGVNERTFFRHFPDKREVLFDGEDDLRAALVHEVESAPANLAPYEVLLHAFRKSAHVLEDNRAYAEPRLDLIAKTPALRERDLAKAAYLSEALAEALRTRGVPHRLADLAAQTGWAAFHHAAQSWLEGQGTLDTHLRQTFKALQTLHNQ